MGRVVIGAEHGAKTLAGAAMDGAQEFALLFAAFQPDFTLMRLPSSRTKAPTSTASARMGRTAGGATTLRQE